MICARTRFIWLRPVWNTTPAEYAWALGVVILDSGVVPLDLLSDGESSFREAVVLELLGLLNSRQGFSMACPARVACSGGTGASEDAPRYRAER